MNLTLNELSEWFLIDASWLGMRDLVVKAETEDKEQICEIVFSRVTYLKVLTSNVSDISRDNEIWSFEELALSPLVEKVRSENSNHWLQETFGAEERSQRTVPLEELRHIVLLSDYVHLELLCVDYRLRVVGQH